MSQAQCWYPDLVSAATVAPPTLPSLVRINWLDSTAFQGWQYALDRVQAIHMLCQTVGYLIDQTPDQMTVSTTISVSGGAWSWHDPFAIPLSCIRGVWTLDNT